MSIGYRTIQTDNNGSGILVRAGYAHFNPQQDRAWELSKWLQSVRAHMLESCRDLNEYVYLRVYLPSSVIDLNNKDGGIQGFLSRELIPGNSRRHTRIAYFELVVSEQVADYQIDSDQFASFVQANWQNLRNY